MEFTDRIKRGAASVMHTLGLRPEVTTLLRMDHTEVRTLYKLFQATGTRAFRAREKVAIQILDAIELHTDMEQERFYAPLGRHAEARDVLARAELEHRLARDLVREIRAMKPTDPGYAGCVTVLCELITRHAKFEENEMFPIANEVLGEEELRQLGADYADERTRVPSAPRRRIQTRPAVAAKSARTTEDQPRNSVRRTTKSAKRRGNTPKPSRRSR